jgi:hypothetical protein
MAGRPAQGVTQTMTCEGCGVSLVPHSAYQMVTAWKRVRGDATLKARRLEQRFACRPCVEAFQRTGEQWHQMSLLDGGQS